MIGRRQATSRPHPSAPYPDISVLSGCIVHVRADDLSLGNGAPVTTWPDRTSNHNDFGEPSDSPTYVAASLINGWPAVRFSGSTELLECRNNGSAGGSENMVGAPYSVPVDMFIVSAPSQALNTNALAVLLSTDGSTVLLGGGSALSDAETHEYNGGGWSGGVTATVDTPTLMEAVVDGTSSSLTLNDGTPVTNTSGGATTSFNYIWLGGWVANGYWWAGDVAEFIAYDRILSGAERTTVQSYFDTKYTLGF